MKKYLIIGALALFVGGFLTSCHDDDGIYGSLVEQKLQTYEQVFKQEFGEINPYQDWGFGGTNGNTASRTRSVDYTLAPVTPKYSEPDKPSFTSKATVNSRKPTISIEGYLTKADDVTATTSGIPAANTITDWSKATAAYLSNDNTSATDAYPVTLYVVDDITFGSNTDEGTVFVVTEGKTLTLTNLSKNAKIILAEGAILDMSKATTWDGSISFAGDQSGLYMSKDSQIKGSKVLFFDGCQVMNNNGTISITDRIQVDKNSILWNDGTFETVTTLHMENENSTVYNAKGRTLNATNITTGNNYGLLYNDGTVIATGDIDLHNTNAEFVNAGTLEAGSISLAAGGKFFNSDDCLTTIHGLTYITNMSAEWLNKGEYNTGDFTVYNAGKLYNDCKLTVHADASGTTGTFNFGGTTQNAFVIMANSSVKTDYFVLTAEGDMWMKENALLWITTKLTSSNLNPETGFHGTGNGYSFIKAADIDYESARRWRMNYFGKIYVDADKHFLQGFDNSNNPADQPHYYFDTDVKLKFAPHNDPCPITEPITGKCHHGYNPNGDEPDTQTIDIITPIDGSKTTTKITYLDKIQFKKSGRVFCEDLGVVSGSDIDFNDVVFDAYIYDKTPVTRTTIIEDGVVKSVKEESNGNTTQFAEIYLLAAGGTLEVSVANINVKNSFGVGKTTMVNTIDETVNKDGTVKDYNNNYVIGGADAVYLGRHNYSKIIDIPIFVTYNTLNQKNVLELKAYQGAAPHKICVPIGTRWPFERIVINEAYKNFNSYVKGEGRLGEVTGPVGENQYYRVDESDNTYYWNNNIEETNLYRDVPYEAPYTGNEPFYENEVDGGSNSVNNKEGGYDDNNMPILVRRRH